MRNDNDDSNKADEGNDDNGGDDHYWAQPYVEL